MPKKTARSFVSSGKIQLRHNQQLPEPADEMTADVVYHDSDPKDPFMLSHMALSLPLNTQHGNKSGTKQEYSDNSASSDDPFKDYFRKLQNVEYFDTDSSSWDQSAASFMSWSDQEIESATTEKVQKLMDDIECILYDEPVKTPPNKEIIEECRMWKEAFPHMRVRGHAIKMNTVPQAEECCTSIIEEEIIAVDRVMNDAEEYGSVKHKRLWSENSGAHCKKDVITEETKSCQLENMVEKYVLQQLSSYIQSEVVKKLASDVQSLEDSSGRKCNKLPNVFIKNSACPRTMKSVPSDSESDTNSTRTVLSKSSHTKAVLSSRQKFCVPTEDIFSSSPLLYLGNYSAEYPSFSVIGSAPVSLPSPRTASSSVHETRSFHSAAERSKRPYADRRFSCGFTAQERSSNHFCDVNEKNEKYKSQHYSSNNQKHFLLQDSKDKLNKRLVLPPINKIETQKMSTPHRPSRALSVHGIGFSRTGFIQQSVAQQPAEKSVGISNSENRKKEQQIRKASHQ